MTRKRTTRVHQMTSPMSGALDMFLAIRAERSRSREPESPGERSRREPPTPEAAASTAPEGACCSHFTQRGEHSRG